MTFLQSLEKLCQLCVEHETVNFPHRDDQEQDSVEKSRAIILAIPNVSMQT